MALRALFVMDPIENIKPQKDTTLAFMLAAKRQNWSIHHCGINDLFIREGLTHALTESCDVFDDNQIWFKNTAQKTAISSTDFDIIFMRKDPPFDMDFTYATYWLELAEAQGSLVVNRPRSLRDCNEKLFTAWFPQCCVPTLVTAQRELLRDFHQEQGDIIVKPLDGMGGTSIFRIKPDDPNIGVILETMTLGDQRQIMAQRFIPDITSGDKRILMINGEPVSHALARIPTKGETRGNLAAGGTGVTVPLSDRDRWIASQVGPELVKRGLYFVGLDVIGDYLTEINVTSPTCARELEAIGVDITDKLIKSLSEKIAETNH